MPSLAYQHVRNVGARLADAPSYLGFCLVAHPASAPSTRNLSFFGIRRKTVQEAINDFLWL
jgi:hypothetical protein